MPVSCSHTCVTACKPNDNTDSKRILPSVFNSFLDKQEAAAEKTLKKVADDKGNFRQRQSSPTWGSR